MIITETGPYGDTVEDILETPPDEEEVELEATIAVFDKLDDFSGEERHRAESFCLSFFRRAGDPAAIGYVAKRWARHPDRAREYPTAPTLVQLAIIHCGINSTAGERNALMNTAQAHGEIQALMCEAFKAEQKAN